MQPGFLRYLAPFALTALLAACGGDDEAGSTDKSTDSSKTASKRDGGLKTAVKHDAGKPKADDDEGDDSSDDGDDSSDDGDDSSDDGDDSSDDTSDKRDGGGKGGSCTANSDCRGGDAGIGCCDVPTGMCFVSHAAKCPSAVTPGTMQPPYN